MQNQKTEASRAIPRVTKGKLLYSSVFSIRLLPNVSHKSPRIAVLIQNCHGRFYDAHYHGFFECFNRQLFYEAHEVLEELWLAGRGGPDDGFYKGLIQLAGAFVHLQKGRLGPAGALFKLARTNLVKYPSPHLSLDVAGTLAMIECWLSKLSHPEHRINPLGPNPAPELHLAG